LNLDELHAWKLHDTLTIVQAALLMAGVDPAGEQDYVLQNQEINRPANFTAYFEAIKSSIRSEKLKADFEFYGGSGNSYEEVNWGESIIDAEELRAWLLLKGFKSAFFFGEEVKSSAAQEKRKHTSELLEILEHAITDNWEGHDPLNPPTNDSIDQWFADNYQNTKGISNVIRESMRTIMRPLKHR